MSSSPDPLPAPVCAAGIPTDRSAIKEELPVYTKRDLIQNLRGLGVRPDDTLLVHSSMKAVGAVEGGADTVLDAFSEYLSEGLLILPTHTWSSINAAHPLYDPAVEPACVGILPNLFRQRPGVVRSLHPTHSLAARGWGAAAFVEGEELRETACPRNGCYGRLYDRGAKILFLGCRLTSNTYLHGVEEWCGVPERITDTYEQLYIRLPWGGTMERPMRRHYHPRGVDISGQYGKMEPAFLAKGIAHKGMVGDAVSTLCDARGMADLTASYLQKDPDLFAKEEPLPEEWY